MPKTIQQTAKFNVKPEVLYDLFLNPKKLSVITGSKASTGKRVGTKFSLFNGALSGKNLAIVPGKMIVQSWRSNGWSKSDLDSVLVLTFSKIPGGGQINLVHSNVPENDYEGVKKGWQNYYWKPWKKYLANKK